MEVLLMQPSRIRQDGRVDKRRARSVRRRIHSLDPFNAVV